MGAMENAGCVTFRDEYLPRSRQTHAFYEQRANTVLHEMAHMWFGDLVTMRWWDDLWLNESFAEWAAHHASVKATEVRRGVDRLHQRPQELGLPAGPAALDAPDRGRQPRPRGRRGELRRHHLRQGRVGAQAAGRLGRRGRVPRRPARLLQEARVRQQRARRPARRARGGLRPRPATPGPRSGCRPPASTRCSAEFEVDDDGAFTVLRGAADGATPTSRRCAGTGSAVGLTTASRAGWSAVRRVEIDVAGERTEVAELVGERQPDLVLLNDGDLTYAKIRLDERSLATLVSSDRHPRRLPGPGAVLGRGLGHDPRRGDAHQRLRRRSCCAASAPRPT